MKYKNYDVILKRKDIKSLWIRICDIDDLYLRKYEPIYTLIGCNLKDNEIKDKLFSAVFTEPLRTEKFGITLEQFIMKMNIEGFFPSILQYVNERYETLKIENLESKNVIFNF